MEYANFGERKCNFEGRKWKNLSKKTKNEWKKGKKADLAVRSAANRRREIGIQCRKSRQ